MSRTAILSVLFCINLVAAAAHRGTGRWYTQNGAAGVCGLVNNNTDLVVGLADSRFAGPVNCGQSRVTRTPIDIEICSMSRVTRRFGKWSQNADKFVGMFAEA
ncbi:hypothetical protein C8R47DRAFT_1075120 [Mycena vitilis]|nr:hypothetical protein C8R47DRAFT_1075120 [Mycena vitilis]